MFSSPTKFFLNNNAILGFVTVPVTVPQRLLAWDAKQYLNFNLLVSTEETLMYAYLFNVLFIFEILICRAWAASQSLTDSPDWMNV